MARRDLLHKSKLEDFKNWCFENRISIRPGKDTFQVLQVCHPVLGWGVIYDRIEAKEHYTVDKKTLNIVFSYITARKTAFGKRSEKNE